MTVAERFDAKVERSDGCWIWKGARQPRGYGHLRVENRRPMLAHRYAYERAKGPIPEGLTIDHLCRNRSCVNPDHLEAVTQRVNILRGNGMSARHARKTHCIRGHRLGAGNVRRYYANRGWRVCLECERARGRGQLTPAIP